MIHDPSLNDPKSIELRVLETYDKGTKSLAVTPTPEESDVAELLTLSQLNALAESPDARERIQSLAPLTVYRSIKQCGPESCLAVMQHLSQEQFTRILDYDAWQKDTFVIEKAMAWIALCGKADTTGKLFFNRFKELDEEYQLSMLLGQVHVIDLEVYEDLSSAQQDRYIALPCQQLYYTIQNHEEAVQEFIVTLINIGLNCDLRYTYALLMHASYMPPNETQYDLSRIRQAHLEEDGFVSYHDSLSVFAPLPRRAVDRLLAKYAVASASDAAVVTTDDSQQGFFDRVLKSMEHTSSYEPSSVDDIKARFLFLVNNVCSAVQIEPDQIDEIKELLSYVKSITGLGLEVLARSDTLVAQDIISKEHPKVLFQCGLALVNHVNLQVIQDLGEYTTVDATRLRQACEMGQWGRLQLTIDLQALDVLGDSRVAWLKGFMNRFPLLLDEQSQATMKYKPLNSLLRFRRLAERAAAEASLWAWAHSFWGESIDELDRTLNTLLLSAVGQKTLSPAKSVSAALLSELEKVSADDLEEQLQKTKKAILTSVELATEAYTSYVNLRPAIVRDYIERDFAERMDSLKAMLQRQQSEDYKDFIYVTL